MYHRLLIIACVTTATTVTAQTEDSNRQPRRIINRVTSHTTVKGVEYKLCETEGIVGACLQTAVCNQEGRFVGYCGDTETYCCKVIKTCSDRTASHQAIFRNPSYPKRDSDPRVCTFEMDIKKQVCGVRLDFDFFELAKYQSGVCIRDTLTVLGSDSGNYTVTPVCGTMTNWTTNFPVKEGTLVTLAMVLQGKPSHKFSIRVTQLPCAQITPFISPTYSGVRNDDAKEYVPTTKPPPTTTPAEDTTETTTTTDMTTDETTTPFATDGTTEAATDVPVTVITPSGKESTTSTSTTTTTTTKPTKKTPAPEINKVVVIKAETEEVWGEDEKAGLGPVVLESVNSVPAISGFRQAFELKVNDKCWQYEDESDYGFRIIGGSYTNLNEYPWQVALVYKGKFFCGGSIISDRFILTASHCVFGSFSAGLQLFVVSMGDHDLRTRNETKHVVGNVTRVHWNIYYNPHTTENDIAILELEKPINFTYGMSAVRLPTDLNERYDKANATVTGWGRFNPLRKRTSAILKEFTGQLINSTACVKAWKRFPRIDADYHQHICLDVSVGTPCHGDSGGPLVVCTASHCTQVGVVSFGFPLCTNVGLPAVFARVTHFKPWLDMTTHPLTMLHL